MKNTGTFFFLACLCGCSNNNLPDPSQLGGLRVLAILSDASEVNPASSPTVTLTPLISDLKGAGRILSYAVQACADQGIAYGQNPSCSSDPNVVKLSGTFSLTGPTFTGNAPAIPIQVPASVFDNRSPIDRFNGVGYLVLYTVSATTGETVQAFKRIQATERTPVNLPPTLTSITSGGSALVQLPTTEADLTPAIGLGAETYQMMNGDGNLFSQTEVLTVSWFVSGGEMKYTRTAEGSANHWTPPSTAPPTPLFLIAVIRDNRGGVGFIKVGP